MRRALAVLTTALTTGLFGASLAEAACQTSVDFAGAVVGTTRSLDVSTCPSSVQGGLYAALGVNSNNALPMEPSANNTASNLNVVPKTITLTTGATVLVSPIAGPGSAYFTGYGLQLTGLGSSASATLSLFYAATSCPIGICSITGSYGLTDTVYAITITNLPFVAVTATSLIVAPNPSKTGQAVTSTATVTSAAGTPSGTVTFRNGATVLATRTLSVAGVAALTRSNFPVGMQALTASYNGDGSYTGSTSPTITLVVEKGATTTALVSSADPSLVFLSVTFTATVAPTAPAAGTPTGSVTFKDNGVALGTVALDASGQAQLATSGLAASNHTITAEYGGSTRFIVSASTGLSQTIEKRTTTTTLTAAPNPTLPGATVALTATMGSAAIPAIATSKKRAATRGIAPPEGTVTFKAGARILGTGALSSGVATLDVADLTTGNHSVIAEYGGSETFAASRSAPVAVTIDPRLGPEVRVNATTLGRQMLPDLARLTASRSVAVWQSEDPADGTFRVYGQLLSSTGVKVGGQLRIDSATVSTPMRPKVAALPGGRFVVVWQAQDADGSGKAILAQRFTAAGAKDGSPSLVNTTTLGRQLTPAVVAALTGGGYVVAWVSYRQDGSEAGIFFQRFAANGTPAGVETQANTFATGDQSAPAMAALTGGGFVVVWTSLGQDGALGGIYGQRFAAGGVRIGQEFRVNTTTAGDQSEPAIVATADGGFVVAWTSDQQDGSGKGVYLQRYRSTGAKSGAQTRVNTTTASDQLQPALTALPGGGFIVIWASNLQDGSGHGVYAQRFEANGAKDDREFIVNRTTVRNQWQPVIAAASDTQWLAAWTSRDQDGSLEGIFAQRLEVVAGP